MIQVIKGLNFSGKTFYLQCYSGFPLPKVLDAKRLDNGMFHDSRQDLYIGPLPGNFLSGIFASVKEEIFRYKRDTTFIDPFVQSLGLTQLYERNPFTLSGGEQVMVTALAFATAKPRSLCIDSTFEQLSSAWKTKLLEFLIDVSIPEIILSDNRIAELSSDIYEAIEYSPVEDRDVKFKFKDITSTHFRFAPTFDHYSIEIDNLSFAYGKESVFVGLNCKIEAGRIYHLVGANGSGKSTLSKILCGVLKPSSNGGLMINGCIFRPYKQPGSVFGYSFQLPDDQLFNHTVAKELGYEGGKGGNGFSESIIECFRLNSLLAMHPFDLPLSMRKRLAIAATLCKDRPFYIFDEPTLYMDDFNAVELKSIFEGLARAGKGVIIISHSDSFIKLFEKVDTIELTKTR
jgi:energy-coupling factor transport system ATP-binding protein